MKRGYIIGLIISVLLLNAFCNNKGSLNYFNYKKLIEPQKKKELKGVIVNKFDIYFATCFAIVDDYLLLADMKADKLIKILDLKSNKLIKEFGRIGQGPDEFLGIRQIIPDPIDNSYFWVYDISTRGIKRFNINRVLNDDFNPDKIINISTEKTGIPTRLLLTPEKRIFSIGLFYKGRIGIFDLNGNYIKLLGKIPVKLKDEKFSAQHSHGFEGNFLIKGNTIYIAVRLGAIIEKYDINGNLLKTLIGPDVFFPDYDIVPAGQYYTMTYNKKSRFGYLDIKYSEKLGKIILLYSGKHFFIKKGEVSSGKGNIIYMLDDKDDISDKYYLDRGVYQIVIPKDSTRIYGLTGQEVIQYDIN